MVRRLRDRVRRTSLLIVLFAALPLAAALLFAEDDEEDEQEVAAPSARAPVVTFTSHVEPMRPGPDAVRLVLRDAVQCALARNKALSVRKQDPVIARTRVLAERGVFDHVVSFDLETQHRETPAGSQLEGAASSVIDTDLANLGLARKFESGAIVSSQFGNQRLENNSSFQLLNPQYSSNLVLSVTQPLARDAGRKANTANLRIAQNGVRQGGLRLTKVVLDTVAAVERQYWDLAFARQDRDVKRFALRAAQELVAFNIRRTRNGVGTKSDVLEARTTAAARAEDFEVASRQLADAEEILRRLLGLDDKPSGSEIFPADPLPPPPQVLPLESALATAFKNRPDHRDLLVDLESRDIRVAFLKNQTRPRVDLVASYAQNGLAGSLAAALDQVGDAGFQSYTMGVRLDLPIENRTARGEYRIAQLEKAQALQSLRALEDQIEEEVTRAVRAFDTDRRRVEVAREGQELSTQQLQTAESRYDEGLIPNIDLLRFQQDLASACTRTLRARIDLVKSGINFEAAVGRLLESRRIVVERLPATPASPFSRGSG